VTFAVEQALEDHSKLSCPVCGEDYFIRDVGSGEMQLAK